MRNDNKNLLIVLSFVIFISISIFCLVKSDLGSNESDYSFNQSGNYENNQDGSNSNSGQNNINKKSNTNKTTNNKTTNNKTTNNKTTTTNNENKSNNDYVNNNVINNNSSTTNNQSDVINFNDDNDFENDSIVKIPEVSIPTVKVTGIKLNRASSTLTVGGRSIQLVATVTPSAAANKNVIWSSSNTKVATVSSNGVVSGKGVGTATITATTKDGSYKATSKVTVYKEKTFTATFKTNGATSIETTKLTCTTIGNSCSVTLPKIYRTGWTIVGWGTSSNQLSYIGGVGSSVILSGNKTFYAITKKKLTATFDSAGSDTPTKQTKSCELYNTATKCSILIPTYTKTGKYDNTWKATGSNDIVVAYKTVQLTKNVTYKAVFKHPWANAAATNSRKDRNLSIQKVYTKAGLRFEYEKGIPTSAVNAHINFINKLYKDMPYLFSPGKVWVLTETTYSKHSIGYGLTSYSGPFMNVDLKYDTKTKLISPNATVHELAHAWDGRYSFKTGKGISSQDDVLAFYNSLGAKKRNNLSALEWFAGLMSEYYWHYLGYDKSEASFAGYKDNYSSSEKTKAINLINKYIKISKNNYVK